MSRTKSSPDKEMQAMRRIIKILEELPSGAARQRVAQYAINRAFAAIPAPGGEDANPNHEKLFPKAV